MPFTPLTSVLIELKLIDLDFVFHHKNSVLYFIIKRKDKQDKKLNAQTERAEAAAKQADGETTHMWFIHMSQLHSFKIEKPIYYFPFFIIIINYCKCCINLVMIYQIQSIYRIKINTIWFTHYFQIVYAIVIRFVFSSIISMWIRWCESPTIAEKSEFQSVWVWFNKKMMFKNESRCCNNFKLFECLRKN